MHTTLSSFKIFWMAYFDNFLVDSVNLLYLFFIKKLHPDLF
ncbi:hypothetical protein [Acinetobacter bereziniae]|nr:hypothetical protein [Acinetobacter bereziniae]